jgi:D-3-phosphoglycerate dehydrogenase
MQKILIPTKLNTKAAELLRDAGYNVVQDQETPLEDLIKSHSDVAGLIVRSEKITADVIDALPNLRLVVRAGAGYNTIDIKHARRNNVDVMNTPGANSNAVAEQVVGMVLAAYRHFIPADASTRAGKWEKKNFMGRELTNRTVGIVGLGNIGRLVLARLAGFNNRVLAYDPWISESRAEALGVTLCDLPTLFAESDVVTLHIPATEETHKMINKDLLGLLPDGAVVVNCARAEVLDEDDFRALKAEKKLVLCNDVYPKDAPGDKPIADIADILLPHLGASTQESNLNAATRAAEQTMDYFSKGVDRFVVNRGVPAGLDAEFQVLAYALSRVARACLGEGTQPQRIETSFYGDLADYADWLLGPVVLGLFADFDPFFDQKAAADYLEEKGITWVNREVDSSKTYGASMTIDLFESRGESLAKASVRGTLAEGNPMVSRINEFDKLYVDPRGHSIVVAYEDAPGMLARITSVVARHNVNIEDIRCPHRPETGRSLAVLKVNQSVAKEVTDEILAESGATHAVAFSFN